MPPIRLAVDVKGGDHGTRILLEGVLKARNRCATPFIAYLCGDKDAIEEGLKALGSGSRDSALIIEHCPQSIGPNATPSRAWKTGKRSSIVRCVSLQKDGVVDASLSAGDTGVLMGASIFLLGRADKITRPALAAFLPTIGPRPSLLLDVGANLDCRPDHLATFGVMGAEYYKRAFSLDCPSVALLNIGHEPSKGTRNIAEAAVLLETRCAGYCGFVEGGRVLTGDTDVVVCDGFAGNVLLKACESFYSLTASVLSSSKKLMKALKERMTIFNPENYGAVPLLGIRGVVFKAHGSSSAEAFANALVAAVTAVHRGLSIMGRS